MQVLKQDDVTVLNIVFIVQNLCLLFYLCELNFCQLSIGYAHLFIVGIIKISIFGNFGFLFMGPIISLQKILSQILYSKFYNQVKARWKFKHKKSHSLFQITFIILLSIRTLIIYKTVNFCLFFLLLNFSLWFCFGKRFIKGYLRHKTINSRNVLSEAQVKNCFVWWENYVSFSKYSSFFILHHPMFHQICGVMMSISEWDRTYLWIYLLNLLSNLEDWG